MKIIKMNIYLQYNKRIMIIIILIFILKKNTDQKHYKMKMETDKKLITLNLKFWKKTEDLIIYKYSNKNYISNHD
jgi:hypothetical protein